MRFSLIIIFFSFLSFGQEIRNTPYYVWAENGLSLRAEPNTSSEKLTTLPMGSQLTFLAYENETYIAEEFEGFKYHSSWIKVKYKDLEGYVVSGYTSIMKPPSLELQNLSLSDYLHRTFKLLDTKIVTTYNSNCKDTNCAKEYILTFEDGIVYTYWEGEGGGTETVSLPKSNILHGFLLAAKFCDTYKEFETVYTENPIPTIRVLRDEVGCDFSITSLDELVIIVWSGGC